MQERPSKRQSQGLKSLAENSADSTRPYDTHDTQQVSVAASQLCQRCENIDLGRWLPETGRAESIGFLDSFKDPRCPLCYTVQHFVKLHWGSELPSGINRHRLRVYMQGTLWCAFSDSGGHQRFYRILLAIDQLPPNSPWMRLALKYDLGLRFVFTELELDPTRLKDAASVPSLRRSLAPCIDVKLLRTWLQECRGHEKCNDHRKLQQSKMVQIFANGFRLIDVFEGKLVEKMEPCEYVALSYVWGQLEPPPLLTKKDNVYALSQPSSLHPLRESQSLADQVPRTIADTITLCRSLGQRYLWVDSICIVQDDDEEKQRLIHGMDIVYENASLTVLALSSSDAAVGLAGITPRIHNYNDEDGNGNDGRERLFHKGHGKHCLGIGRISIEEHIRSSHWNTRGWTYQEQLLSPRKLYFSSNEVFYECECHKRREGYKFEGKRRDSLFVREAAPRGDQGDVIYPMGQPLLDIKLPTSPAELDGKRFLSIVSVYTQRDLTEPGDILNAFTGIYHRLDGNAGFPFAGINALQGHPSRNFFSSLLWVTLSDDHERRSSVNGTRPSTWSWTTFAAPIDFAIVTPTSFPKSLHVKHSPAYSMVDDFRLYFQSGDNVNEIRLRNSPHYRDFSHRVYNDYTSIRPQGLLELYSETDPEDLPAPSSISPGVLEFLGPYIPKPTVASSRWFKTKSGEWLLSFEGKAIRGLEGAHNTVSVARFDPGEDILDGIVLLSRNWCYLGLCVRKRGEYFERVGIVIFTPRPDDWQTIAAERLLNLSWKRILLR